MPIKSILFFLFGKIVKLASLLVAISFISFILISHSPIDPIQSYIGADITRVGPEQRENIEAYWGLNESLPSQYISWAKALVNGELGTSLLFRMPVIDIIQERFFASILLMSIAWLLSGIFGLLLGIIAGLKKESFLDKIIKGYCYLLSSTPTFWIGLLCLMIFSVWLGIFPVGLGTPAGVLEDDVTLFNRLQHLFLPALTLSIIGVANVTLHTRQKLIDVYNSEYIRYAKAKGEKGWTLLMRQGIRNISLPAISLQFTSFGELFGGAIIAEQIFSYPGLGQAIVQAGLGGDVPLFLGIVLFSAIFVFSGNAVADFLLRIVDPRIRKGGESH